MLYPRIISVKLNEILARKLTDHHTLNASQKFLITRQSQKRCHRSSLSSPQNLQKSDSIFSSTFVAKYLLRNLYCISLYFFALALASFLLAEYIYFQLRRMESAC